MRDPLHGQSNYRIKPKAKFRSYFVTRTHHRYPQELVPVRALYFDRLIQHELTPLGTVGILPDARGESMDPEREMKFATMCAVQKEYLYNSDASAL